MAIPIVFIRNGELKAVFDADSGKSPGDMRGNPVENECGHETWEANPGDGP